MIGAAYVRYEWLADLANTNSNAAYPSEASSEEEEEEENGGEGPEAAQEQASAALVCTCPVVSARQLGAPCDWPHPPL